jgi:hypothetical protein
MSQDMGMNVIQQREQKVKDDPSTDKSVDTNYIKQLLGIQQDWQEKILNVFADNALLQKAFTDALHVILNKESSFKHSTIELLATYGDQVLKGGIKMTEVELEVKLDQIIELFNFVMQKDVFMDIYRNLLAKRLLSGRSASRNAEISMISKLKLRHGAQFTGKLEGMLRDLDQGKSS